MKKILAAIIAAISLTFCFMTGCSPKEKGAPPTMTYLYITEKQLYQKIDMIVAPDGQIIEQEGEDPEERNKRLFKYWM